MAQFTTWQSQQEHEIIKAKFPAKSKGNGLRVTIGSVDSTHTEIKKPTKPPARYFDRKKNFLLVLQAICDTDYRFTDVFVGFPGSAHDARVLKESSFFENIARKCSDDCILKNAVHPLLPELMPPYKENQATFQNYKDDLNKYQRAATEKAFGILKQRFRQLYFVDAETTNLEASIA